MLKKILRTQRDAAVADHDHRPCVRDPGAQVLHAPRVAYREHRGVLHGAWFGHGARGDAEAVVGHALPALQQHVLAGHVDPRHVRAAGTHIGPKFAQCPLHLRVASSFKETETAGSSTPPLPFIAQRDITEVSCSGHKQFQSRIEKATGDKFNLII